MSPNVKTLDSTQYHSAGQGLPRGAPAGCQDPEGGRRVGVGALSPSLVMVIAPPVPSPTDVRILSIPFGPKVDLTRSATAMAPTKLAMRAFSPLSTCASALRTACAAAECA